MATNQGFQSIACNPENNNLFVFYAIKFHKNTLLRFAYGTTFLEISKNEMKKIKIPIPELYEEQEKIGMILSNVDSLIHVTENVLEQTQRLKKGLMQKLLTRGIGHTKFKIVSWIFTKQLEIPEEWEQKKLEDLVDILDSKRVPIEESEREKRHGPYPYYGASGLIDYIDDYLFDEELLCLAEDGENLRSRVLPIAFTIKGKTWVNNHAHVLRPKQNVDHHFLEFFLNHMSLLKYVSFNCSTKIKSKRYAFNTYSLS